MGRRKRRRFTPEFKAEAVRMMTETDAPVSQLARELGVSAKSLHEWFRDARPPQADPLTEDERTELIRLRRDIKHVRMERDILKKATAFFARQSE